MKVVVKPDAGRRAAGDHMGAHVTAQHAVDAVCGRCDLRLGVAMGADGTARLCCRGCAWIDWDVPLRTRLRQFRRPRTTGSAG